jgi:hypothetical protein
MSGPGGRPYSVTLLWVIVLAFVVSYGVWDWRQDQLKATRRAEAAARQRAVRCELVTKALAAIAPRGRSDLAASKDGYEPCERAVEEGCAYEVELRFELTAADRADLSNQVGEVLENDCEEGLSFARKHGLAAFRDHQAIVDRLTEEQEPPDLDR